MFSWAKQLAVADAVMLMMMPGGICMGWGDVRTLG